jgi:hypothetical protein
MWRRRLPDDRMPLPGALTTTPLFAGGTTTPLLAAALAVGLAAVHPLAERVPSGGDDHRWIVSTAGGASLAYVLVLVLPEVNEAVLRAVESTRGSAGFFSREMEVYVVVLLGFLAFYGVHAGAARVAGDDAEVTATVFRVHLAVFAAYEALVGYLLFHQERSGPTALVLYGVAMALHFLVTDEGLRRHHGRAYDRLGRWVLAAAVLVGGATGALTTVAAGPLALAFAFLAGAIVCNVLKEELPAPDANRFGAFLAGALGYTAILLAV